MALGRASLLLLAQLLACCAAVHGEPPCDAGDVSCKATPAPRSLLQVRNAARIETTSPEEELELEQALRQRAASATGASALLAMDAACAEHMQANRADPAKVGQSLMEGVQAIGAACQSFMQVPPDIPKGISTLSTQLFVAVEGLLPQNVKTSNNFPAFRKAWMDSFNTLPNSVQSIQSDITAFSTKGDEGKLVRAIQTILVEVVAVVTRFLPQQTGNEVAKYMGGVSDLFGGVGGGITAFNTGDAPAALEAIYNGLHDGINTMVPKNLQNDPAYQAVFGVLDGTLGTLSKTVLQYKQQLENSDVCWRGKVNREKVRPSICPNGYQYDGQQWCGSRRAALLSGLDAVVEDKAPEGALPAVCASSQEKRGSWCYKACPRGYDADGATCKVSCAGAFPSETIEMCGRNAGAIASAIFNMIGGTFTQLVSMTSLIASMAAKGLAAATQLKATMQTLIDLGKPFAHPKCPVPA